MKKRPRGIFTFTGNKGGDGRRDQKISLKQQFFEAADLFNRAVFSNKKTNKAICKDVFDTPSQDIDLVYIDPPYVSEHSDCDYTRRYHFVEGLCTYWLDKTIQRETITKKFRSYPTAFKSPKTIYDAFYRLFSHFRDNIIVVSYGSNGIPNRNEMTRILGEFKKHVRVEAIEHKYCHGNHRHKVGKNNNDVLEYLFIGT